MKSVLVPGQTSGSTVVPIVVPDQTTLTIAAWASFPRILLAGATTLSSLSELARFPALPQRAFALRRMFTRRFLRRPDSLLLSATGMLSP
jgi:hypothetical protein